MMFRKELLHKDAIEFGYGELVEIKHSLRAMTINCHLRAQAARTIQA